MARMRIARPDGAGVRAAVALRQGVRTGQKAATVGIDQVMEKLTSGGLSSN
jgi:hypothetical protein